MKFQDHWGRCWLSWACLQVKYCVIWFALQSEVDAAVVRYILIDFEVVVAWVRKALGSTTSGMRWACDGQVLAILEVEAFFTCLVNHSYCRACFRDREWPRSSLFCNSHKEKYAFKKNSTKQPPEGRSGPVIQYWERCPPTNRCYHPISNWKQMTG